MTEQIDIIALQIQAEETVRAEYEAAWKKINDQQVVLDRQQEKWSEVVKAIKHSLLTEGHIDEDELPDADAVIDHTMVMLSEAFMLKKMLKMINENELLKSQWDRLVMSIRLAGGDQND